MSTKVFYVTTADAPAHAAEKSSISGARMGLQVSRGAQARLNKCTVLSVVNNGQQMPLPPVPKPGFMVPLQSAVPAPAEVRPFFPFLFSGVRV